jgi:multidrug resistance efflux pump
MPDKSDELKVELKSEVLNEVLSTPPTWLVRSGNTLFFITICLVLAISYLISYPDVTIGDVSIYSSQPPIEFQNQIFGKLVSLTVKDQHFIKKGTVIAQFDNEIDPLKIEEVKLLLSSVKAIENNEIIELNNSIERIQLGTIQSNWTNFLSQIEEWNSIKSSNIINTKVTALQNEIKQRLKLNSIAYQKLRLVEKEIIFQRQKISSSKRLLEKSAISKDEYIKEMQTENQLQQQFQNQKEAIVQNEIQLNSIQKSIKELAFDSEQQLQKIKTEIKSSVSQLQTALKEWEKNSAWIAPFDGKILFNKQLHISSFYKPGEASIVLVPKGNKFNGIVKISSNGAGKIEKDQKVFIELSDFPKNEYGMIECEVKSITSVAKENYYEVQLSVPKKLITTYKIEIPLKAILKGNAKIVTKNKRLIERFFEKVIDVIRK